MGCKLQSLDPEAVSALFQHQTGLLPRQLNTFSSANDQTLVIAKMPLTSLGLYVSHQTIPLCLLPGLPMLHASHKVCVQDELLLGDAEAYCRHLSNWCPCRHDQ